MTTGKEPLTWKLCTALCLLSYFSLSDMKFDWIKITKWEKDGSCLKTTYNAVTCTQYQLQQIKYNFSSIPIILDRLCLDYSQPKAKRRLVLTIFVSKNVFDTTKKKKKTTHTSLTLFPTFPIFTCWNSTLLQVKRGRLSASGQDEGKFIKYDSFGLTTVPPRSTATCVQKERFSKLCAHHMKVQ